MPITYAVIMAGGSGTRFWPVSRSASPKQLTRIIGETTMIQATVARLMPLITPDRVLIITTAQLAVETRLAGVCPNCGGGFARRPIRPARALARDPASTRRVVGADPGCAG